MGHDEDEVSPLPPLAEWVKRVRKARGLSQEAFAAAIGVSKGLVSQWENGIVELQLERVRAICDSFQVTVDADTLLSRTLDMVVVEEPDIAYGGGIPVVGEVKAGADGYLEEFGYPVGTGTHRIDRPTSDPHAYALRVRGDSMQPKYEPGDLIIVEPSRPAQPGDIVVVKMNDGRKMLKKLLFRRNGELTLGSINQDYRTLTLQDNEVEALHFVGGSAAPNSTMVRQEIH